MYAETERKPDKKELSYAETGNNYGKSYVCRKE